MEAIDPAVLAVTPLLKPPPGVVSNFVDPDSCSRITIIVGIVCLVIMLLLVFARIYVAFGITRVPGIDDCKTG